MLSVLLVKHLGLFGRLTKIIWLIGIFCVCVAGFAGAGRSGRSRTEPEEAWKVTRRCRSLTCRADPRRNRDTSTQFGLMLAEELVSRLQLFHDTAVQASYNHRLYRYKTRIKDFVSVCVFWERKKRLCINKCMLVNVLNHYLFSFPQVFWVVQ